MRTGPLCRIVGGAALALLAVAPAAAGAPPSRAAMTCFRNMRAALGATEASLTLQLDDAAAQAGMVLEIIAGFDPTEGDLRSLWGAAMESIESKLDDCELRVDGKARNFMRRLERRDAPLRLMRRADQARNDTRARLAEHAQALRLAFESRMGELFPEVDVGSFDDNDGPP